LKVESETVTADDGTVIPLTWFHAAAPCAVFVFLPALGIQSKLYCRLAGALAERGITTCLMEQRGHGASDIRIGRGTRFGVADFVDKDIPAILDEVESRVPGLPVILGGHSLGGHLSTIYAGMRPERLSGIAHIACGFPYHRDFPGSRGRLIKTLCLVIPLAGAITGFFPGKQIGFAGRESITLMQDWRGWAMTGRFDYGGRTGVAQTVSRFAGPVLSVSFEKDEFSSPEAVDRALSPFSRADVTRVVLGEAEQGDCLGHFGWAREPAGVVSCLADWIEQNVTRRPGTLES